MTYQEIIDEVLEQFLDSITGIIAVWTGAIADIPEGWLLCDGNNGTPNLRNRFIVGAGDTYNPDDTGGAVSHNHIFTSILHQHTFPAGTGMQAPVGRDLTTNFNVATGTTDNGSSLPPYNAQIFIKKV